MLRKFFINKPERERGENNCWHKNSQRIRGLEVKECFDCELWKAEIYEGGKLYTTAKTSKCYGSWVSDYAVLHLIYQLKRENYKGNIEIGSFNMINYNSDYVDEILKGECGLELETFKDNDVFWYYAGLARIKSERARIKVKILESTEEKQSREEDKQDLLKQKLNRMPAKQRINWMVEHIKKSLLKGQSKK